MCHGPPNRAPLAGRAQRRSVATHTLQTKRPEEGKPSEGELACMTAHPTKITVGQGQLFRDVIHLSHRGLRIWVLRAACPEDLLADILVAPTADKVYYRAPPHRRKSHVGHMKYGMPKIGHMQVHTCARAATRQTTPVLWSVAP